MNKFYKYFCILLAVLLALEFIPVFSRLITSSNPFSLIAYNLLIAVSWIMISLGLVVYKIVQNKKLATVLVISLEVAILLFVKFWFY